jgi:hypothetical protein
MFTVSEIYEIYYHTVADVPGAVIPRHKFAPIFLHVCREKFLFLPKELHSSEPLAEQREKLTV